MYNFCIELSNEIIQSKKYIEEYEFLCLNLASEQIRHVPGISINILLNKPELDYLLKCANVFIQTDDERIKEQALRIAQYTLQFGQPYEKDFAYFILDVLVNNPSIELAKDKEYLDKNIEFQLPLSLCLQKLERENEYSFETNGKNIICNPFQKNFITNTNNLKSSMLSVTAPTSSGKSFIVLKWIINNLELKNNDKVKIGIIVPTRALINQYARDIKKELENNLSQVYIETMPFRNGNIFNKRKVICIFTQERMSAFLSRNVSEKFKILFVDEAQKIGDNQRGVLLETIIEKIKNNSTKIVFASPYVKNPEEVFIGTNILKSELMPINQNFFKIDQRPGNRSLWDVFLIYNQNPIQIATIQLDKKIEGTSNPVKLATFVDLIMDTDSNNLIFANDGKEAEDTAEQLYQKSDYNVEDNKEIQKLIKLCEEVVNKKFILIKYLRKGIAFHYGSMPQLIRIKIEDLFNQKIIKTLICTSTLLEGVNLSCKNIFIRNPKRTHKLDMSIPDVFNLAGRAGRLGKEFYGNIFYIDWEKAPLKNEELEVTRTIKRVLNKNTEVILESLEKDFNNIEIKDIDERNSIEATIGYLYIQFLKLGDIGKNKEVNTLYSESQIKQLNISLNNYSKKIKIPKEILDKHPIMYHYSMQKLFEYFETRYPNQPKEYLLDLKNDDKIIGSLIRVLNRMNNYFNTGINNDKLTKYIAYLVKHWIKFQNLGAIINIRRDHYKNEPFNNSVRYVFKHIDDFARYLVPKLLRCYIDVLNFYFEESGNSELIYSEDDMEILMEYGIETKTQMSMITLGLSRATVIKLCEITNNSGEYLLEDMGMEELKTLMWLQNNIEYIKSNNKLPELLTEEILEVINSYRIAA